LADQSANDSSSADNAGAARRHHPVLIGTAVFVAYAAVSLIAQWPAWPGDPNRIRAGDLEMMSWFLAWTPHALLHGQNLFATTWLNYPNGVDLAQNTSAPLLGLLSAPLTLTAGPVASVNLLLWLAFPLSAFSMYFVLRRWVGWTPAAIVGGALYGFSPYVVTQAYDHLNLAFVPLPPLILLCGFELVRPGSKNPVRWGVALGVLVVAQFFVTQEIAATSLLVAILAGLVLALARPREIIPALRRGIRGALVALAIVAVGLSYPIWAMTAGPYRFNGPAYAHGVSADLLGSVAPTFMQKLAPTHLSTLDARLVQGLLTENDSYLGVPLLLLLIVMVAVNRRDPWIRFAGIMVVVTTVLSLGPELTVANHITGLPLPWDALQHLPLADSVVVVRLSLFTSLFAALLLARGMDDLRRRWQAPVGEQRVESPRDRVALMGLLWLLGFAGLLCVIPAWPFPTNAVAVPAFFSSPIVDRIPFGSVALIEPYPSVNEIQPQVWQAIAGMRFRIIGGYALVRNRLGHSTNFASVLSPEPVQRFLWADGTGEAGYPPSPAPADDASLACETRTFLIRYRVDSVIQTDRTAKPMALLTLFRRVIGPPTLVMQGTDVWLGVLRNLEASRHACG
jgi:hypothetical protein